MRRVRVTIVAVEKQWELNSVSVCLQSCIIYPVCRLHLLCAALHLTSPYYIVSCGLSGSTIFFHIISLRNRLSGWGKRLLNVKCVLIFSKISVCNNNSENNLLCPHSCAFIFPHCVRQGHSFWRMPLTHASTCPHLCVSSVIFVIHVPQCSKWSVIFNKC